ncbi:MAG: M28 family metallopeptidase [Verrucomicrobiota bacterium]
MIRSLLALLFAASAFAASDAPPANERRMRAHVTFLADDLLEGRAAGTRGHALAMAYVSAQHARLGLEPAGTEGYLQPMTFRESKLDLEAGKFTVRHAGSEVTLTPITDTIVRPGAAVAEAEVSAAAVFVGFGISAPEFGYDDFGKGIDLKGKIAVILAGSPTQLPATARAHYSRNKVAELARRGAVAIVTVETPVEEKRTPWALTANRNRFPTMRLVEPDGSLFEAFPAIRATASVSRPAGAALFKHAPTPLDVVFATAVRGEAQAFPLGIEIALAGRSTVTDAASANVLAWLPGTDPALAGNPIVVTGHLDHIGIGPAVDGDSLYNGAIDNALGTAVILEVAERLAAMPRMRRPVLFASLTAEEKGLLGAYHLSRQPPPRVRRFAANVNIDMPLILAPTRQLIALGADHSTLGASMIGAAERTGFTITPDPLPDEVFFVRSDQYPFVRAGIPALALKIGEKSTDPTINLAALQAEFRKTHYHKPSDDLSRSIHWPTVVNFADVATELIRTLAEDSKAPAWLPNDFFGTRFGPK